jgi:hypothetical protein
VVQGYLETKPQGGFSQEGLVSFLDLTVRRPHDWNVRGAADELFTLLWDTAWRNVTTGSDGGARRAKQRRDMLDSLQSFVDAELDGDELDRARKLVGRSYSVVDDQKMWKRRPAEDQAEFSSLCLLAGVPEETDDGQKLFQFTFGGGKRIEHTTAFPDANVPGKIRQVLDRFCTVGQYELHARMSRKYVDDADAATNEKEEKLAWLLDRTRGDRSTLIFNLRDHIPDPSPQPEDRPSA